MRLLYSPTSPFARKVLACAIARGIDDQIALITTQRDDAGLVGHNPLAKVPCLVTDDGVALFDSRVICEFLDSVGDVMPMFPSHGPRFRALQLQALGDGICDAAVHRREEQNRTADDARTTNMARQKAKVDRGLDFLENDVPAQHIDIGTIAIACALGYLDFRFAEEPWRPARPKLANWYDAIARHPCIENTKPA